MRKKLTLLFALLCVSMMSFAIDWSGIDYVPANSQYKAVISPDVPAPGNGIVDVQSNAIYVTFPSADFDFSEMTAAGISYSQLGAGIFFNLSNFATVSEMSVTIGNTYNAVKTIYTLTVHNDNPLVVPSTKAPTPATPSQRVRAVYSQYPLNAGMTMLGWSSAITKTDVIVDGRTFPSFQFGNYLGLGYGPMNVSMMDQIHLDIWTENTFNINFFLISPGTENYYTIELTGGTWNSINIPLSTFTADKTRVTEFKFADASVAGQKIFVDNIYFYANDDLSNPDPSEVEDTNFALRTNGSVVYASTIQGENYPARAIDGDNGTQWESVWNNDPQWMVVDFGQRRIFNTVNIYWGNQWAREFYLETSDNGTDWTEVKHVTDNTSDHNNSEQSFQLDANATARYIRFRGIVRANDYGYTIKEFGALLAGVPVLTSVGLSSNKEIVKIGEFATLTAEPKDQNNQAIAADLSYSVSPSGLGHVEGGKYYPDNYGLATITVTAETGGVQVTNNVQIWGVTSDNLALNNALDGVGTWYSGDTPAKAVDGNDGSVWQGCTTNTTSADQASRTYDAWFTVDLKSNYDIQLITIHFEGACSDEYQLYGSTDNDSWTQIYSWEYPDPQSGNRTSNHTDLISMADLNNADNVRYLKFLSTRAASEWGMKIYEMEVYGAEASSTKTVSATASPAAGGTVTITAAGSPVTEVISGTEVTFTATPNDGYLFINWTQGGVEVSTDLEYETTITANTALVANFRALGNIYCNTEMTVNNHTIYVTMKRSGTNQYKLVIRSEEELDNFGGTVLYKPTNVEVQNIRDLGVLSAGNHTLTATVESDKDLYFGTPLYVKFAGVGEVTYAALANIEYEIPCNDDNVPVESISLNYDEATIEIGATKTLVVSFNPVYATDKSITWTSSNGTVASVDGGVVTANAIGTAIITAETSNGKTATCEITVEPVTQKTCWGVGNDFTYQGNPVSYDYAITRNTDKTLTYTAEFSRDVTGLEVTVNVHNNLVYSTMSYDSGSKTATFTTTEKFNTGNSLQGFFYFGGNRTDYNYTIGEECAKPSVAVTGVTIDRTSATLMIDETVTLTAEVVPANASDKEIVWENSDPSVASFESSTGLVTALAVGTTTITAKSHADESIFATCVVTVVNSMTPATWYGYSTVSPLVGLTAYTYSITRGTDHKLTFTMTTDKNVVGYVSGIEGDVTGAFSGYDAENHTGTFTTAGTYTDGTELHLQLTFASESYGAPAYNFTYTVGSKNDPLPQAVAVDEEKDNNAILTTYDGRTVIGVLGRSFTAGNLYTLVLPFDVDAAQTASQLPGQLTKLNNSYLKENGDLRINFVDAEAVEAGVPYLYTPSADVTNPVFTGVTVSKDLYEPADGYAKYYGIYAPTTGEELKNIPNAYVLGSDQYLYAASVLQDNQPMKALRGYFVLNFQTSANAPRARVIFNNKETEIATGISDVQSAPVQCTKVLRDGQLLIIRDGRTYNAQGQWIK